MKVIYNNKEVANTTLNYNELFNKPLLNSHELVGNTSLNDIGVYSKPQVDNLIASTRSIKVVSALPTPLVANTMYYVGPDQNNLYHIYLVDSSLTLIDLGMSQDAVYLGGNGIDISSDNEISVVFDNETLMLNSEGELYVRPATENVEGVVSYDNVSIKKNSSGKIYIPTTKSGDRFGVYPFTNAAGNTEIGKAIGFYTNDSDTGWKGELRLDETNHQLVFGDYTTSPAISKPLVAGETTASGNRYDVYPYTDAGGITFVGRSIRFVSSDTDTGVVANIDTHTSGTPAANTGNFWVNNGVDSTKSGIMLTTGLVDNKTIKYDGTNTNIYVNNSDTIVGTTDADKIALTKNAVQKYTDTLVKHANTGATQIPTTGGVDLNSSTYTVVGNYYVGGNFTASNITNCPTNGNAFQMTVRNPISSDVGEIGNYTYRIRDIITYVNERWTQRVSRSDSGIYYGAWNKVLTSDSGLPFVLSGKVASPAAGEGGVRNTTNYQGEAVKIGRTGSGTGLYFRGAGIARYNTIKASYTVTLPAGGVTLTNGVVSELYDSSTNVIITGMQADGTYYGKNAHSSSATDTWTITGLIPSYNVYELQYDITWQRGRDAGGSGNVYRWLGTGNISLTDASLNTKLVGTIHIRGTCQDAVHVPCFEFQTSNLTPEMLTYCVEFY